MPGLAYMGQQAHAGGGASRLRRGCPQRARAEVVDAGLGRRRVGLNRAVAAESDDRAGAQNMPGDGDGEVVLSEVKHVRAGREGHVGAVVHRQQAAVPTARGGEYLQQRELFRGLEALLPQLHDVHPGGQHGVEEPGQVALAPPRVRAQVKPRIGKPRP